jgi:hypothetical protein
VTEEKVLMTSTPENDEALSSEAVDAITALLKLVKASTVILL